MKYEEFKHLRFERPAPGVLRVTIDRGDKLNAVNHRLHEELGEIWLTAGRDTTVDAVLVTGKGDVFSAGGDLQEGLGSLGEIEATIGTNESARRLVYNMIHLDKPIVSAINGPAAGAGLAVALAADISMISDQAFITDAHMRIGIASGDHAVMLWPLFCGMPKAKRYLLTGDRISGPEAERIGLVSACVPAERLQHEALEMATRLARLPRQAVRWTKRCLNHWLQQAAPIFDLSVAYEGLNMLQRDAREGVDAFLAKRDPDFRRDPK